MSQLEEASPICRGKNLSWETILLFYNNMPRESMPKAKFHSITEAKINGWTQTHSQIARQLAFYYEQDYSIGSLTGGLDIKNPQLYKLNYAPICRHCDAYQCRRCIWLNKKTTLEVNTPSHEQCVVAHIERNASRELLRRGRELGEFLPEKDIKEIDYLDPFEKRKEWEYGNIE